MKRMTQNVYMLLPLLSLIPTLLFAAPRPAAILGLIVSPEVKIDQVTVPSGTTLLDGSLVVTGKYPAVVHLESGNVVRLSSNSKATFQRTPSGSLRIAVEEGEAAISVAGTAWTIAAIASMTIPDRRDPAASETIANPVAILTAPVEEGDQLIHVNDTSQIDPALPLFITDQVSGHEQVQHYDLQSTAVHLQKPLENRFESLSVLTQSNASAGASSGTTGAGASTGQTNWQLIGILAGSTAAGTAALVPALTDNEEAPPSPIAP